MKGPIARHQLKTASASLGAWKRDFSGGDGDWRDRGTPPSHSSPPASAAQVCSAGAGSGAGRDLTTQAAWVFHGDPRASFVAALLSLREKALGPDHPDVATVLNGFGILYEEAGRFAEAESLYKRSLAIREKALGPDHPDHFLVAQSLNNLAELYERLGRYTEAEPLNQRALAIFEKKP
jgi:tetratricopeptide (TPR) repeat protein